MRQTEPDASGRIGVKPIPGTESLLPCTTVIAAIGQEVLKGALTPEDGVKLNKWGWVEVDDDMSPRRGRACSPAATARPARRR